MILTDSVRLRKPSAPRLVIATSFEADAKDSIQLEGVRPKAPDFRKALPDR
jgi:hypothetical protein